MQTLQNGSDIRGIAIKTETHNITLSNEIVEKIALGFLRFLSDDFDEKRPLCIAVGRDSRLSGPALSDVLIQTFERYGHTVIDCKLATTPAMFMTTLFEDYSADAAIMVTASHLPYFYNGLKFFRKSGGLDKSDITEIIKYAMADLPALHTKKGKVLERSLLTDYAAFLRNRIIKFVKKAENPEIPLHGFHIIVDAGNGAGGFFATKVLEPLGADITYSQFLEPDGTFPNHIPNPENKEAMQSITNAVIDSGADLGIIFDTDVDRAALVAEDGSPIGRNQLIALISTILLVEKPNATIVTDSITTDGLTNFLETRGGTHHRYMRGYRNVINEAIRLNEAGTYTPLAIETSGHAALLENHFLDDGAYLVARILGKAAELHSKGKTLATLIKDLRLPVEESEVRYSISREEFRSYGSEILVALKKYVLETDGLSLASPNYEGIRVNCDPFMGDGWFLLRLSLHEPVMALNLESNMAGGISVMQAFLDDFLAKYDGLSKR